MRSEFEENARLSPRAPLGAGRPQPRGACQWSLQADLNGWKRHPDRGNWNAVVEPYEDLRCDECAILGAYGHKQNSERTERSANVARARDGLIGSTEGLFAGRCPNERGQL
jgi:hypothetical protein